MAAQHTKNPYLPVRWKWVTVLMIAGLMGLTSSGAQSAANTEPSPLAPEADPLSDRYPAEIRLASANELSHLVEMGIDIASLRPAERHGVWGSQGNGFTAQIATVYVNADEAQRLAAGSPPLQAVPIPNWSKRLLDRYGPGVSAPNAWPTYDQFVARMQALAAAHPEVVRLISIGQSVQGRTIYLMKISDNPDLQEDEPELKLTSTIHGDEVTGAELTMRMAELLANTYTTDAEIAALVNGVETWLGPIHNPDGYAAHSRYNAHGKDLNRNFPDRITDPNDSITGREPETQAYMLLGYARRFVMGLNYHGGAQVVNYPWDSVPSTPDYAPDDSLYYNFSSGYASLNPMILNGGFPNGVTRGWEWYIIRGGMQDWVYHWRGEHHVTIEVSQTKAPPFEQMDNYWDLNREAMLWWMQRVLTGARGRVLDARNSQPLNATVDVQQIGKRVNTDPAVGDYHRLLLPGSYTLVAASSGYLSQSKGVNIGTGQATVQNFALCPAAAFTVSGTVTGAIGGQPLAARLDLVGAPVSGLTDPATGQYSLQVCPAAYTLQASAPGYLPEHRAINVSDDQIQNFSLLPVPSPDLSTSDKQASPGEINPGEAVEYRLVGSNTGSAAQVAITDTLPAEITWNGSLTATSGTAVFLNGQIHWAGALSSGEAVTITYGANLQPCLAGGMQIVNLAEIWDGAGEVLTRTAAVAVLNSPPEAPVAVSPTDGETNAARDAILRWSAIQDRNCDPVTYSIAFGEVNPPPVLASVLPQTFFDPGPLQADKTYYWSVTASDGASQVNGGVWSFHTSALRYIYLPVVQYHP